MTTIHNGSIEPDPVQHEDAMTPPPLPEGQLSRWAVPAGPKPPRRWKLWLLTSAAIYPVITALGYLIQAVGASLPVWARFVVMVPIAVALLVFVVMPFLTKTFHGWLER